MPARRVLHSRVKELSAAEEREASALLNYMRLNPWDGQKKLKRLGFSCTVVNRNYIKFLKLIRGEHNDGC
jgi:hypothetical protein